MGACKLASAGFYGFIAGGPSSPMLVRRPWRPELLFSYIHTDLFAPSVPQSQCIAPKLLMDGHATRQASARTAERRAGGTARTLQRAKRRTKRAASGISA